MTPRTTPLTLPLTLYLARDERGDLRLFDAPPERTDYGEWEPSGDSREYEVHEARFALYPLCAPEIERLTWAGGYKAITLGRISDRI